MMGAIDPRWIPNVWPSRRKQSGDMDITTEWSEDMDSHTTQGCGCRCHPNRGIL